MRAKDESVSLGRLRILMISPQYRPIVGGYEKAAERLSTALAAMGHSVTVVSERRNMAWPKTETLAGVSVRRLWCAYRPHLHMLTALVSFALFLLFRGRRFDVWHVHQYGPHAALTVALGLLMRRPVVLKLTSSTSMSIETAIGGGIGGHFLGFFHRRVSACVAVSEETREEAIHFGIPSARIYLIPNGVDGNQFHPVSPEERASSRRRLGLNCERLVLFVGRLSPEKNPLGLLAAWSAVNPKVRESTLLAIVGDGPDRSNVQAKAKESCISGSVHLAGGRDDVDVWYCAADVYIISSNREGLSNTMIEALASGLPVISTRVSGSSILLESPAAGHVVDVGDVQHLASTIELFLQDKTLITRFGANARLTFESHFSLETTTSNMLLLYESLLNRNKNRGSA